MKKRFILAEPGSEREQPDIWRYFFACRACIRSLNPAYVQQARLVKRAKMNRQDPAISLEQMKCTMHETKVQIGSPG